MKRSLLATIFLSFFSLFSFSQSQLNGRVVDSSGEPVSAASVYVKETKQGLVCNSDGEFQTRLAAGTYHCEFRCMGYETQIEQVVINKEELSLRVVLMHKEMQLQEVVVNRKEDPAYEIMRKTIAKAPYHRSQVKEAKYEAYIKGSGKSLHVPKLMEKIGGEEVKVLKDKLFIQESFSEVQFTEPDKYVQTVQAFASSMPNDSIAKDAMGVSIQSLYNPKYADFISPLNPNAFSYYRFQYEGYEEVDGELINKIKVIRKLKDPQFLEGYLYIADEVWNIRHAELDAHPHGSKISYDITYNPVAEHVYLVTSYVGKVEANILGLQLVFNYLASLKYTDIQLNDSLIAAEKSKEISSKKKEKKSLEIKKDERYKTEADSLATRRDSVYWTEVRNVTLNEEEIQSYSRKDTLQVRMDSVKQKKLHPKFSWSDILMGGRIGGDSAKVSFRYDGLLRAFPEYNFVDGFWAGQSVELHIKRKEYSRLTVKPMAYWAWSRERLLWKVNTSYTYAPMKLGQLEMSVGSISEDYNDYSGMLRIENAIYSAFMGINNATFYQKDYFKAGNEIDIANGLQLGIGIEIADRQGLDNYTTYSLFGDKEDAKPNLPPYPGALNMQYSVLAKYGIRLKYTPEYYYSVENEKKRYVRSRFPTFYLDFQQGVPSWLDNSTFYRADIGIEQSIRLGIFDELKYFVGAGKFFNDNAFNYIDYKHFNAADQLVSGKLFYNSYSLLDYYTYSTNKNWIQAFVTYNTQYLLLKRLPFLQGKMFSESLHGKFLHTPEKPCYSEWGYAVGLPKGFASAGVFVSFDSFELNSFGVRISLPMLNLLTK